MWYESQILGVVVGAVLGFLLSFVPAQVERYRHRRSLKRALLVEIKRATTYLDDRRHTYLRYRDMVTQGGLLGVYTTDRSLDAVYRANLADITCLSPDVVARLVEFYEGVNEFSGRIRALSSSLRNFHTGSDKLVNQDFFVGALDRIVAVIDRTVERGHELLEQGKPNHGIQTDGASRRR